jgi:hypothetical protein
VAALSALKKEKRVLVRILGKGIKDTLNLKREFKT